MASAACHEPSTRATTGVGGDKKSSAASLATLLEKNCPRDKQHLFSVYVHTPKGVDFLEVRESERKRENEEERERERRKKKLTFSPLFSFTLPTNQQTKPKQNQGVSPASRFSKALIKNRVATEWGGFTLASATRALLRAALLDPNNQRFALLSESCVPLYSPAVVYSQLVYSDKSRINACADGESF